jgi:FixJ family two-component response regulator
MAEASSLDSIVYVVDDDDSVRKSLLNIFRSVDLQAEIFDSPSRFLEHKLDDVPSCLVLDVRMPGSNGLDFQAELTKAGVEIPIIFLTAHGDIQMSVQAMKAGAIDFITKPYREQDILDAVTAAIERDRKRREDGRIVSGLREQFATLSYREREIMALVTAGLMNKQAAAEVGLSEITVKIHRGNIMRKMHAKSFAELVRMAEALQIGHEKLSRQTKV